MPAIDDARCYHQGVRVPDLDAAMAELGAALSLEESGGVRATIVTTLS